MKKLIYLLLFTVLIHCAKSNSQKQSDIPVAEALCLSSHLKTGDNISSGKIRAEELRLLSDAGVKYLRRDFLWHEIEPERGRFDFSGYDRIVNEAKSYGMKFIGLLAYGNTWASESSRECIAKGLNSCTNYPPDNPEDFANFVFQTVSHFKDNVHLWEIWNEPNFGINFFKPFSDPKRYGEILKRGYESAKSADPEAIISFGGVLIPDYWIEPSGIEFLNLVFSALPDARNYLKAYYALKNLYEIAGNYHVAQNISVTEDNNIYRV